MPQIRDEHDQLWIVTEYVDVNWPAPRIPLRDVESLVHATLAFKTPDGRMTRILRAVAPLDWRAADEATMRKWLRMAKPSEPPRAREL